MGQKKAQFLYDFVSSLGSCCGRRRLQPVADGSPFRAFANAPDRGPRQHHGERLAVLGGRGGPRPLQGGAGSHQGAGAGHRARRSEELAVREEGR